VNAFRATFVVVLITAVASVATAMWADAIELTEPSNVGVIALVALMLVTGTYIGISRWSPTAFEEDLGAVNQPDGRATDDSSLAVEDGKSRFIQFIETQEARNVYRPRQEDPDISVDSQGAIGVSLRVFLDFAHSVLNRGSLVHFYATKARLDRDSFTEFLQELNEREVGVLYTFTTAEGLEDFWTWWFALKKDGRELRNIIGVDISGTATSEAHQAFFFQRGEDGVYSAREAFDTIVDHRTGRSVRYYERPSGVNLAVRTFQTLRDSAMRSPVTEADKVVVQWCGVFLDGLPRPLEPAYTKSLHA